MKWYWYLICIALIIAGTLSSIELYDMFNVQSKEYGNALVLETKKDYNEISKFDLISLEMESTDNLNYTFTKTFSAENFNGKDKNYVLMFNNREIDTITSNGSVSGTLRLNFYGVNNELLSIANVQFEINYYATYTQVVVTMRNNNNSLSYFSTLGVIEGAILSVIDKEVKWVKSGK